MELQHEWPLALGALGAVLISGAGLAFVFGGRQIGKKLLLLGLLSAVAGAASNELGFMGVDWRAWLPDYIPPDVAIYGLYAFGYAIGFLVVMGLLRSMLAFFVGKEPADAAVGHLLATAITSVFTAIMSVFALLSWPFRALRRMGRSSHSPFDDT